jgi:tetratricopeptide (TPR) repeat protein
MFAVLISIPLWLSVASTALSAAPAPGVTRVKSATAGPSDPTARRGDAYFHLIRARLKAVQGGASDAVSEMRAAVASDPDSADLLAEVSVLFMQLGRRTDAETAARQAVAIDPGQRTALRVLGDLAAARYAASTSDRESLDEAIRIFALLSEAPDADDDVFAILARLKMAAGDREGALREAERFSQRRPWDLGAARFLSQLLLQAGREREALKVLAPVLADPDALDSLPLAADLARRTGQWDIVEEACEALRRAGQEKIEVLAVQGEALLHLERYPEAVTVLEKARDLDPDNPLTRFHLGMAFTEVGRIADAVDVARRLASDLPNHPSARAFLGESLSRQGDIDGALEAFKGALDGFGADGESGAGRRDEIRRRMAALEAASGRNDAAARLLNGIEVPDDPVTLELRANLALRRKDLREAQALGEKLGSKGMKSAAAMIEGQVLLSEGRSSRAMRKFEEAERLSGRGIRARIAEILDTAGHASEAESLLRGWVGEEPSSAQARFRLGAYLERKKRYDEAEQQLREAIRLDPANPEALNYLGYSLADRNLRLEEALAMIRKALEIDPWNGAFLDSLGWVYYRLGRYPEAREPLERAFREYPFDATILEHLGDLYEKTGQTEAAVNAWKRALECGSENAEAIKVRITAAEAVLKAPSKGSDAREPAAGPDTSTPAPSSRS